MEVMLIVVIGCVLAALLLFVRHAVGRTSPAHRDDDLFTPVAPPPSPAARPLDESPSDLFTPVDAGYHAGPRCFITGLPVVTCTCPRHRQKGTRS